MTSPKAKNCTEASIQQVQAEITLTSDRWLMTGDKCIVADILRRKPSRANDACTCQRFKPNHMTKSGLVMSKKKCQRQATAANALQNWTVQQLGTRSKPIKASQNSTLDWNYCGSDYLSAKLPKTKAKLMLQWWSGYQGFPGLKASREHADDWAPASERRTKLQMKETHHCKTVQQRLASYYLKPS